MLVTNAIQQKLVVISPLDRELQFTALKASCALMKKNKGPWKHAISILPAENLELENSLPRALLPTSTNVETQKWNVYSLGSRVKTKQSRAPADPWWPFTVWDNDNAFVNHCGWVVAYHIYMLYAYTYVCFLHISALEDKWLNIWF